MHLKIFQKEILYGDLSSNQLYMEIEIIYGNRVEIINGIQLVIHTDILKTEMYYIYNFKKTVF